MREISPLAPRLPHLGHYDFILKKGKVALYGLYFFGGCSLRGFIISRPFDCPKCGNLLSQKIQLAILSLDMHGCGKVRASLTWWMPLIFK